MNPTIRRILLARGLVGRGIQGKKVVAGVTIGSDRPTTHVGMRLLISAVKSMPTADWPQVSGSRWSAANTPPIPCRTTPT